MGAAGGELEELRELFVREALERRPKPLQRPAEEDVVAHDGVVLLELGDFVFPDSTKKQFQFCSFVERVFPPCFDPNTIMISLLTCTCTTPAATGLFTLLVKPSEICCIEGSLHP